MDESNLKRLFYEKHKGKSILKCIQCGTCSGSCPLGQQMDHAPREIFALIRDGEMKAVLSSNTPWYCASCYYCIERCPKEIPVTELMYALKQMSMKNKTAPYKHKIPDLYDSFTWLIEKNGRVTEPLVMARYSIKHPMDAIKSMPLAIRLMLRKRLEIMPQEIKNKEIMKTLLSDEKNGEETP